MATFKEALDLLTAYRREVETLMTKHCDPDHPESWLAPKDRRDAYEGVRSAHERLDQCLCRLMGQGRAHDWLDPIARGEYEFTKLATPFEPGWSEKHRTQRIEYLRWLHESSDLRHDLDALEGHLRANVADTPTITKRPTNEEWYVWFIHSLTNNQTKTAEAITSLRKKRDSSAHPYNQGQVSRSLAKVELCRKAGHEPPDSVLDTVEKELGQRPVIKKVPERVISMDPALIDAGKREDTGRHRQLLDQKMREHTSDDADWHD